MSKRKKLKLAVAAACSASCSLEQIINLCPTSFAVNPTPKTRTLHREEEQEHQQEDPLFLHNAALLSTLSFSNAEPGWWVRPRKPAWFDKFLHEVHDRESWMKSLRMSKQTFIWLCNQLQPLLNRQHTHFRAPIPVAWRLGSALYRLTAGADFKVIGEMFGMGVSSAQICVTESVKAINQHFRSLIGFPQGDDMKKVVDEFYEKCELVNCGGAAGRVSFKVMASSGLDISGNSISVQGVCDTRYRFLDVSCSGDSEPGRSDDPRLARTEELLSTAGAEVGDLYLVGDESFPLLSWLLVAYPEDTEMAIMAESFNRRHSVGVMHVRVAFGALRETFKVLSGCIKHNVTFVPGLVSACCVLHNVLVDRDEIPMRCFVQAMEGEGDERLQGSFEDERGVELRDQLAEMYVRKDLFRD